MSVLCLSCTQVRVRVRGPGPGRVLGQEPLVDIPDTLPTVWGVQAGLAWRSPEHRRRSSLTTSCSSLQGKLLSCALTMKELLSCGLRMDPPPPFYPFTFHMFAVGWGAQWGGCASARLGAVACPPAPPLLLCLRILTSMLCLFVSYPSPPSSPSPSPARVCAPHQVH